MFSFAPQLRFFIVLLLGGLLAACSQHATEKSNYIYEPTICAPAENIAVCFFRGALIQGDSPTIPIYEALKDTLALPLEELRIKRYVGRMGEPDNRTLVEIFNDYFTCDAQMPNGDRIDAGTDGFLEALKQPEVIPSLKKLINGIEEDIRKGNYWE